MRLVFTLLASAAMPALGEAIASEAAAVEAAKRYTKARCTAETPCTYKARREGNRWNVFVQLTTRAKGRAPAPAGHVLLYFDREGNLVRRVEGE